MLELIKYLSAFELSLYAGVFLIGIIQFIYGWFSNHSLVFYKMPTSKVIAGHTLPPVSVIICAKNEARNLEQFLPLVLQQDYPEFQVIVINDCSDDDSEEVLQGLQSIYPHLYFTTVKKDPIYCHGKKLAVTLGIKAAKFEHLMFTDADCYPVSVVWLRSMAKHFSDTKSIVLGLSPYQQSKGLLGQMIGYETLMTAISYVSSALRNRTYMGIGRNMGYTKTLFYENKGFSGHTHLLSGDDDLFINKAATATNVAIELSPESTIKTLPKMHWDDWLKQKRRHLSTGPYYKTAHKVRFAFEGALGFLFYASILTLLILNVYPLLALLLLLLHYLNRSLMTYLAAKKLNWEKSYMLESLWLSVLVPVSRLGIFLLNKMKPQRFTWR